MSALEFAANNDVTRLAQIANDATQRMNGALAVQSASGVTPLFVAARERHLACVELLLEHADDAGVNLTDGHERTPLHIALETNQSTDDNDEVWARIAWLLVAAPAVDVCARDAFGVTPLHLACKTMRLELAAALISRGAKVDAATARGQTALHWTLAKATGGAGADDNAVVLMVQLLLAHGADPSLPDSAGVTPLALLDSATDQHRALRLFLTEHIAQKSAAADKSTTTTTTTTAPTASTVVVTKKPAVAKKTVQIKLKR